ncbi:hypothetical protein [Motilibacter deserti]|uniref:TrbC/VIRB2 family protein n=1 Tax=Motilibacter deserti TaxID=2714956 RepID=A0ABX0GYB2_9ACTN|nr:hypothetical protein [Motilibacter deserti]NHC15817.1 hypothetical protein [Motilibacter deserti]
MLGSTAATLVFALTTLALARPASAISVTNTRPPGTDDFQTILNWAGWGGTVAGVVGLIVVGIKFMLAHKRGDDGGEQMAAFGKVCAGLVVLAAAGPIVTSLS